jgi:hypothetical protein
MAKGDIITYHEDGEWKSKVEGSSRAAHVGGNKTDQQGRRAHDLEHGRTDR